MEFRHSLSLSPSPFCLSLTLPRDVRETRNVFSLVTYLRGKAAALECVCTERCFRRRFQVTHKCLTKIFKRNRRILKRKRENAFAFVAPCDNEKNENQAASTRRPFSRCWFYADWTRIFFLSRKPNKSGRFGVSPSETSGLWILHFTARCRNV